MNIATEIASSDFVPEHPELHHYTTIAGLDSIYQSQTIWAMQFDQLNDPTEFTVLKEPLSLALGERFATLLKKHQRQSLKVRRAIQQTGGGIPAIAKYQAFRVVKGFYESSFQSPDHGSAYLSSFCAHAKDDYARQNGLLSNWLGYGKVGGGYCLVFDTAALLELLQKEFEAHHWVSLRLDQVFYRTSNFSIEAIFGSLLDEADELLSALLQDKATPIMAIAHFMRAASLLKHQSFREENEVRIVGFPATQNDADALRAKYGAVPLPPLKGVCSIDSSRGKRCYVPLFKTLGSKLPIKRVIVGPSNQQADTAAKAELLFGSSINVVRSETPFIE